MRWVSEDRLRAVSALRRVRAPAPRAPLAADSCDCRARLPELLGATVARNRYGEFLRVRRWLAEPGPLEDAEVLPRLLRAPREAEAPADSKRWLFLDTETTGLAGGTGTCAFLVGLGWWERGGFRVEQLFLRDYDEEHAVLLALAERLEERPVLVTYNGKSFDWPLLETRFRLTRQIEPQLPRVHLDLLHPARQLWRCELGTARLAEIERLVLGLERGPDVLSDLIPQMYFDFLRGGSPEPLVPVFEHNRRDLVGLATLARHLARLANAPETGGPLEQYGLSRLLERAGARAEARRIYQMALGAGLPRALGLAARRRLARLARRDGESQLAQSLWREMAVAGDDAEQGEDDAERQQTLDAILDACEQLAIHYEHRERNREEALEWARHAAALLADAESEFGLERKFRDRWRARLERRFTRLENRFAVPGRRASGSPNRRLGLTEEASAERSG